MIHGILLVTWTFMRMALMRRKGASCDLYVDS